MLAFDPLAQFIKTYFSQKPSIELRFNMKTHYDLCKRHMTKMAATFICDKTPFKGDGNPDDYYVLYERY